MKPISNDLYNKVIDTFYRINNNLRKKGMVIPMSNEDGSITIGKYTIVKELDSFYKIVNRNGNAVVERINLPQTAVIVANELALGRFLNRDVIQLDTKYGYALFEEMLYRNAISKHNKKSKKYLEVKVMKFNSAQVKKKLYKQNINDRFEKLRKIA